MVGPARRVRGGNDKRSKRLPRPVPRVRVDGLDRTVEAPEGGNLYRTLKQEHVNLHWTVLGKMFNCRGIGLCGLCQVRVVEANGDLPPRTRREERRLKGKPEDWRLACQLEVREDLRIEPFPLRPLDERFGKEAVALAKLPPEERQDWVRQDRKARREKRRELAIQKVGRPSGKRGLLSRLIPGRSQDEEEGPMDEEAKPKRRLGRKRGPAAEKRPKGKAKGKTAPAQATEEASKPKGKGRFAGLKRGRKGKGGDGSGDDQD